MIERYRGTLDFAGGTMVHIVSGGASPFAFQAFFCQVLRSCKEGIVGRRRYLLNVVTGF